MRKSLGNTGRGYPLSNHRKITVAGQELDMLIRHETQSDIDAIFEITRKAFENHPHTNHTEQFIINSLRMLNALTLSLVAEVGGKPVGHVAFSPVTISDGSNQWYGLGPVSVLPAFQKKGVGKSLIREGLSLLEASGAKGCVLVGDPGYYGRFGFKNLPDLVFQGVPQEYFLVLPFGESKPRGHVTFHEGFTADIL
jgi:putative acetyltransferase